MAKRPKDEEVVVEKKGIDWKVLIPKIIKTTVIALDTVLMLGATYIIYDIKIGYKRPPMNEETESQALNNERLDKETRTVMLSLDPFVANLDGAPKRTLRTTIQVEMLNEEGYEEAMDMNARARDMIMHILNGKNYSEIETIQGKLFLKEEIITAMNKLLKVGTVKDIFFGEFVVQ